MARPKPDNDDIRPIMRDWDFQPGKISVRKIVGDDGQPKIQMRLDLGLIQMEPEGRPDGTRPQGFESLLDLYMDRLEVYRREHQTDLGFELTPDDCREIREEALQYYHRYLASFILEDFDRVIRDTQRNLATFDLCHKYATKHMDRMVLEQYRPYVLMMNTRAKAHLATKQRDYQAALDILKSGLRAIKKIYIDMDQPEEFHDSVEASILRQLGRRIRRRLPGNPLKGLERKLQRAIEQERFEDAAKLRDRIEEVKRQLPEPPLNDADSANPGFDTPQ
jgi:hypothetical protein